MCKTDNKPPAYAVLLEKGLQKLKLGGGAKKYIYNFSWLYLQNVVRMGMGFLVAVWVIRYLGPDRYGILSYVQSLVALVAAVASLGIDQIVIRELVRQPDKRSVLLGTAFAIKLSGASLAILLIMSGISLSEEDSLTRLLTLIIAAGMIFKSVNVIDFLFQADVRSKYMVLANLLGFGIMTVLKVVLILMDAPLLAFGGVILLDSVFNAIRLVFYYKKEYFSIGSWSFDKALAGKILKESYPLILSGISISIGMRIDQIMLKSYLDAESVGVYAAGVRLAEVFNFIPMIVGQSIYPKLINLNLDAEKEKNTVVRIIRGVFFALAGLAVGINLISYYAVSLLYGEEYIMSYQVLNILIWTIPMIYLGIITNKLLLIRKHNITIFVRQALVAFCNVGLNLIMIPYYGIVGSAIATLAAIFIVLCLEYFIPKLRWVFVLKVKALFTYK
ncbi:O-antigen/teichoic acid export membrane protein [Catalinimonas alkaloidigena]|uniref:flippase n=1 Tax=Catalinimonas alkaloidigena TaxID=1075417 RepID=UPI0024058B49|nr:flippase [Catalinimonas alkaloidigena]MDF9799683.1 O-antigen/teichoic acid export membrane protein [Catalinimonas alkaloidigena]